MFKKKFFAVPHLATCIFPVFNTINQNWVHESILAWLWPHFHVVLWMRWDSNPQPFDSESSQSLTDALVVLCFPTYWETFFCKGGSQVDLLPEMWTVLSRREHLQRPRLRLRRQRPHREVRQEQGRPQMPSLPPHPRQQVEPGRPLNAEAPREVAHQLDRLLQL